MDTPRIRHIAICTKDPAGTAEFYEAAFGVKVVERSETDEYRAVFCTDGSISIALLDFKSDDAAAHFNVDVWQTQDGAQFERLASYRNVDRYTPQMR